MHPDIYAFWEKQGYKIIYKSTGIWMAYKNEVNIKIAYKSFLTISKVNYPDYYIWDSKYVSEEHMLKIIKMKVFL